jgi:hypothetical protein
MGANLMFYVATPPVENWVSHFDNTEFQTKYENGSWTGSEWYSGAGGGEILLEDLGTWADHPYRPTHIRITFNGPATLTFVLIRDKWASEMNEELLYVSGEPIEINWAGTDGFEMSLYDEPTPWNITNIEFLEPVV